MTLNNQRFIFHFDLDSFFASVEMLKKPEYQKIPIAIGGGKRGVLATCNYAAREFGVRSAMPTQLALKKCPHLKLISGNYEEYKSYSEIVFNFFRKLNVPLEPLGLDEGYLDLSSHIKTSEEAIKMAISLKKSIYSLTGGLTISIGIAPNKFLAKVASEWNKPNGIFLIDHTNIKTFIKNLSIQKINGIGPVLVKKLNEKNIFSLGDLQLFSKELLNQLFGSIGETLYNYSRGIDSRQVRPRQKRKSLSIEETYIEDLKTLSEWSIAFNDLLSSHQQRLLRLLEKSALEKNQQFYTQIKRAELKFKFNDFSTITKSVPIAFDTHEYIALDKIPKAWISVIENIFNQSNRPVRLLGVGVVFDQEKKQESKTPHQVSLF